MTFRQSRTSSSGLITQTPTEVDEWRAYIAKKGDSGSFYATVAGKNTLYEGTIFDVASQLVDSDQTFSRPYSVSPGTVRVPHTQKFVKGSSPAEPRHADELGFLVEYFRMQKKDGVEGREAMDRVFETPKPQSQEAVKPRVTLQSLIAQGWEPLSGGLFYHPSEGYRSSKNLGLSD